MLDLEDLTFLFALIYIYSSATHGQKWNVMEM